MTTRDELVALASELHLLSLGDWADSLIGIPAVMQKASDTLERLASRQEVSVTVEELSDFLRRAGFKVGCSYVARARALLAEHSITKRTDGSAA